MRTFILSVLSLLLSLPVIGQQVRTHYRLEGMTHVATDFESFQLGGIPSQLRVELVGFPDGSTLYLLYINLIQKDAISVPKGAKMGVTLANGKLVRLEQIGQSSATPRRLENGSFLNRFKYAAEPADMEKMALGVKSLDIITGWGPDDYIQVSWPKDELGALLKRHCNAILDAYPRTVDLEATLAAYSENTGSILSTANPLVGRGKNFDYNILLSHLYYKDTNEEDLDLAFVIGTQEEFHIPIDSPVRFTLGDGSVIALMQARDDVNFVYVYPTLDQLYRMEELGITGLSIDFDGGTLEDTFVPDGQKNGFSDAVNQQLQLLLSTSPR